MIATRDFLLASSSGPDVSGGWANVIGPYAYANAGQFLFSALRRKDQRLSILHAQSGCLRYPTSFTQLEDSLWD